MCVRINLQTQFEKQMGSEERIGTANHSFQYSVYILIRDSMYPIQIPIKKNNELAIKPYLYCSFI